MTTSHDKPMHMLKNPEQYITSAGKFLRKHSLDELPQINGRDELEIPDKARLDGEYAKNLSFAFDLKCFFGSIGVFGGDESVVEGGTGAMDVDEREKER